MFYRIFTEDKNRPLIKSIVNRYVPGYTLIPATGYWEGQAERSLIIEILQTSKETVHAIARDIKAANEQQAVLVQEIQNDSWLV